MRLNTLLDLAKSLNEMGWAVVEQLESVEFGDPLEGKNTNALRMIANWLRGAGKSGDPEMAADANALRKEILKYLEE